MRVNWTILDHAFRGSYEGTQSHCSALCPTSKTHSEILQICLPERNIIRTKSLQSPVIKRKKKRISPLVSFRMLAQGVADRTRCMSWPCWASPGLRGGLCRRVRQLLRGWWVRRCDSIPSIHFVLIYLRKE